MLFLICRQRVSLAFLRALLSTQQLGTVVVTISKILKAPNHILDIITY